MNEQLNKPQDESLKSLMRERLKGLLRKPAQEQKEKRPENKLWIAMLGFNGTMAFLDLVSAITVGMLTNYLYGVLTFLSGFLALLLHENLFTNAHANLAQKWIAVSGGVLAIVSTLGVGVMAGIVNVLNLVAVVSVQNIELTMIIGLVVVAVIHAMLWGVYYFTDAGHIAAMKSLANMAYRDQQRRGFEDAKKDLKAVKELSKELDEMGDDAPLVEEAYRENTGRELVTTSLVVPPAGAMTEEGFRYRAEDPLTRIQPKN